MNYYALIYEVVDDYVARRTEFREQHLRVARAARERAELVLAGAFDPVDRALLVFRVDDKEKVEDFARKDPYVVNGLVKKWEVRLWRVVVGHETPVPSAASPAGSIVRQWSARAKEENLQKYLDHFSKNVVPELRRINGYLGATVSTRPAGNEIEIFVETLWRSLESIRAFAGSDIEASVVTEEAAALLTSFDRRVRHYEVSISASS
jgi:uncharacterized protein YciI/heme-degrading monooxygenase HmoA